MQVSLGDLDLAECDSHYGVNDYPRKNLFPEGDSKSGSNVLGRDRSLDGLGNF